MITVYLFLLQKIPPGMEFNHIVPHDGDMEDADGNEEHPTSRDPPIWAEVLSCFNITSTSPEKEDLLLCNILFSLSFYQAVYSTCISYM